MTNKIIMIVAVVTAFIAGSALTSALSNFEAEARDEKVTLDSLAAMLENLQTDVDQIQVLQGILGESLDDHHETDIDVLSAITEDVTSIKGTTESTGQNVDGLVLNVASIKTTTEGSGTLLDNTAILLQEMDTKLDDANLKLDSSFTVLCGIGTSPECEQ